MKKERTILLLLATFAICILVLSLVQAEVACTLTTKLINQDPYPATPGDYVKLVFQIDGISNPNCGTVTLALKNKFPISFDPGDSNSYTAESGVFERNYGSFATVPFRVKVSNDAVLGDNPIETSLSYYGAEVLNNFSLSIEELRADFDVYVKNYVPSTNIITLEILNTGKSDTKAVSVIIPPQDSIVVKGPNQNIAGDLDANEYTTTDFEVSGTGGKVNLQIDYTDKVNVRRSLNKTIEFDPNYFVGRKADQKPTSIWTYVLIIAVIVAAYLLYRRYKKNKKKKFD
jgi:hypothetical protein